MIPDAIPAVPSSWAGEPGMGNGGDLRLGPDGTILIDSPIAEGAGPGAGGASADSAPSAAAEQPQLES
eukprot:8526574-Alexandrium_andersonii.AAC.1